MGTWYMKLSKTEQLYFDALKAVSPAVMSRLDLLGIGVASLKHGWHSNIVDAHILKIRLKMSKIKGFPFKISTVRGVGYKLEAVNGVS